MCRLNEHSMCFSYLYLRWEYYAFHCLKLPETFREQFSLSGSLKSF